MSRKISLSFALLSTLLVIVVQLIGSKPVAASKQLQMDSPPPPTNDNIANAADILGLPFYTFANFSDATLQTGEAIPNCANGFTFNRTIWYRYTPSANTALTVSTFGDGNAIFSIYRGNSLSSLTAIGCRSGGYPFFLQATGGQTYYFQVGNANTDVAGVQFGLEVTPLPYVDFYTSYYQPSTFDPVYFYSNAYDPAGIGIQTLQWDLGDGTTATGGYVTHQYAKDGDYTVRLTATTFDGRTNTASRVLQVRTRDVAILKFVRPNSGKEGTTAKLTIGVNSKHYVEDVTVDLYKSSLNNNYPYNGFEWVGSLRQSVAPKSGTKTTDFLFSYTFTAADAAIGTVIFKAVAHLNQGYDIFPADNEVTTLPIPVAKRTGNKVNVSAVESENTGWTDDVTQTAVANIDEVTDPAAIQGVADFTANQHIFIANVMNR